mmetsp:Transcript_70576/g.113771  ORF Transcript_70576/g.113771 Transcript_70576/m.113771 type:complete len:119 (-) Transcript_70576:207-563(-)
MEYSLLNCSFHRLVETFGCAVSAFTELAAFASFGTGSSESELEESADAGADSEEEDEPEEGEAGEASAVPAPAPSNEDNIAVSSSSSDFAAPELLAPQTFLALKQRSHTFALQSGFAH